MITPIPPPNLPEDVYRIAGITQADMDRLMNTDALLNAGALPGRTSATEVNTRSHLFGIKLKEIGATLNDVMTEVGKHTIKHVRANMRKPWLVRIAGTLGELDTDFLDVSHESLQADVDVTLEVGEREQLDTATRRQQALDFLERMVRLAPIVAQQTGQTMPINWGEFVKYIFNQWDDKGIEQLYEESQPLPAQALPGAAPAAGTPQDVAQSLQANVDGRGIR
jgi:hypothetical protein